MVALGLRNSNANDGNYKKPFNGAEQLPSNGFVRAKAASNRWDRASLLGVNEPPLKRNPREASRSGDRGSGLSEVTGKTAVGRCMKRGCERDEIREGLKKVFLVMVIVVHGGSKWEKKELQNVVGNYWKLKWRIFKIIVLRGKFWKYMESERWVLPYIFLLLSFSISKFKFCIIHFVILIHIWCNENIIRKEVITWLRIHFIYDPLSITTY